MPDLDFYFQFLALPVKFPEVVAQALDQLAERARQTVLAVLQDVRQALGNVPNALGDDDAVGATIPLAEAIVGVSTNRRAEH